MNLSTIQQSIADDIGIDIHPGMTSLDRQRARQTSDLQTVIAFQWDQENGHPPDTPASRRQCARYVKQNVRRMRRQARQQNQDAIDSRTDPNDPQKCKFIFLVFLLEAFFGWLIGRFLDAWWDHRNAINDPNDVRVMLAMGGEMCCAVMLECKPASDSDDDDGDNS